MQMTEELERLKNLQDVLAEKYEIEAKYREATVYRITNHLFNS